MANWNMLTLVGEDQPGIVAHVTDALYRGGYTLGEASMMRLGGSFTIMMMVDGKPDLESVLRPVAEQMNLRMHIDPIVGGLHQHQVPNIQVRVVGADRPGIVAKVTTTLDEVGFNILELESDVAGTEEDPVYIMNIQGYSDATLEAVQRAMAVLRGQDMDVSVRGIETLYG